VRSVIITGVSRGLGSALFDEFRAAGDRILAVGRRFTDSQHAAERADPQRVRLRQADLTYPATLPAAAELASFLHSAKDSTSGPLGGPPDRIQGGTKDSTSGPLGGPPDRIQGADNGVVVLVHNAAVLDPVGAIGTLAADEIQAAVTVNLTVPMLLTNAVVAAMGGGRELTVLFVSSGAARRHIAGWAVYSATKLAGESYFEALAAQYDGRPGIRVVSVNPGTMDTDMQGRIREHAKRDVYFPDRDRFVALHQRGELAAPAAVARRIMAEHVDLGAS
jgi:benzil reductase ((S)-benzoin forming)